MHTFIGCLSLLLIFVSCDSSKMHETPESQFIGTWKLSGRSMFDGLEIKISRNKESKKLEGQITKLNDNKYVQMFAAIGDPWVTKIERNSNFEFTLTEQNIAKPLFSSYGLESSKDHKVQFLSKDKFYLDSKSSEIYYIRVK